jgi:hypothetical protein
MVPRGLPAATNHQPDLITFHFVLVAKFADQPFQASIPYYFYLALLADPHLPRLFAVGQMSNSINPNSNNR